MPKRMTQRERNRADGKITEETIHSLLDDGLTASEICTAFPWLVQSYVELLAHLRSNRDADKLLCAAKHWQNNKSSDWCCHDSGAVLAISRGAVFSWLGCGERVFDWAASMALSEAARLADTELVDAETGE